MYATPPIIATQMAVTAVMRINVQEIIGAEVAIRRSGRPPFSPNG